MKSICPDAADEARLMSSTVTVITLEVQSNYRMISVRDLNFDS